MLRIIHKTVSCETWGTKENIIFYSLRHAIKTVGLFRKALQSLFTSTKFDGLTRHLYPAAVWLFWLMDSCLEHYFLITYNDDMSRARQGEIDNVSVYRWYEMYSK